MIYIKFQPNLKGTIYLNPLDKISNFFFELEMSDNFKLTISVGLMG